MRETTFAAGLQNFLIAGAAFGQVAVEAAAKSNIGKLTLLACALIIAPFLMAATALLLIGTLVATPAAIAGLACATLPALAKKMADKTNKYTKLHAVINYFAENPIFAAGAAAICTSLLPIILILLAFAFFGVILALPVAVPIVIGFIVWRSVDASDRDSSKVLYTTLQHADLPTPAPVRGLRKTSGEDGSTDDETLLFCSPSDKATIGTNLSPRAAESPLTEPIAAPTGG